jgi:DNA-binding LacI/PurR family transcriptional regulator
LRRPFVEEGQWEVEGGYRAAQRLLDRAADVTAIYAQNDTMAVGVLDGRNANRRLVVLDAQLLGLPALFSTPRSAASMRLAVAA